MNSKTIKHYQNVAALNKETYLLLNTIGWKWNSWGKSLIKNNKILLSLEVNDENKETNEWVGIVSTMKIFIKKMNSITIDKIDTSTKEIKREMGENKAELV